ncbi:MAG TPA: hypothetical protein VLK22_01350 [Candidatus Udaeobacter sp.]|nr:hypothetical protein [Candidatus Udaeobacter sp.]
MCDDKMDSHNGMGGCGCGAHGGCHGYAHKHLICLLAMVVVGIIVFCTGVKIGMLKAYYMGWDYDRGGYPMMNYQGYGMMRGGWNVAIPATVQETTSSKK